jgi:hypothetical protein
MTRLEPKMPWSIWTVAILLAVISLPLVGEYVAMVFLAFGATVLSAHSPKPGFAPFLTDRLVSTTGINPTFVGPALIAALILVAGLCCLIKALWDQRWTGHAHTATLSLGFLAAFATAFLRLSNRWPL